MDTKKLAVGQDVYMFHGHPPHPTGARKGRVVAITSEGVDVDTGSMEMALDGTWGWNPHAVRHFDTNGKERDRRGVPLELDDMPFAERTAAIEQYYAEHPHLGKKLVLAQDVQKIMRENPDIRLAVELVTGRGYEGWSIAGQVLMVRENKSGARLVSRGVFDALQAAGLLEEERENTERFIGISCNLSPEEATVYKLRESTK